LNEHNNKTVIDGLYCRVFWWCITEAPL